MDGPTQVAKWIQQEREQYAYTRKYARDGQQQSDNRRMIVDAIATGEFGVQLQDFVFNYLKRVQLFGLDTPQGRQALGKAVMTLIDYLETAVDHHGAMPRPGVPSGEILPWELYDPSSPLT